MEKKDAKIKCTGCGAGYKLRIPVTDKPVSFKCKKCGKILKLKIKSGSRPPETRPVIPEVSQMVIETTQLPDSDDYQNTFTNERAPEIEDHTFGQAPVEPKPETHVNRRWIVLSGENVKGPFSDDEIIKMISEQEITPDTSLRMGERPWIKAVEAPIFKNYFRGSTSFIEDEEEPATGNSIIPKFSAPSWIAFPFSKANLASFAILCAISALLFSVLAFDFFIGIGLNILGWIMLYGYLTIMMKHVSSNPESSAPDWDFSQLKNWILNGAEIFLVFFLYGALPISIMLLVMTFGFLNGISPVGYGFMALVPLYFLSSMYMLPAAMIVFKDTGAVGAALNPGAWITIMKTNPGYRSLGLTSVVIGLVIFLAVLASVFIIDIPIAGFAVTGVMSGLILAYANFLWFYNLGRFTGESESGRKAYASA